MKYQTRTTGSSRRDQILDAAERAILQKGVSATTIEELIAEVGVSKNGFFYHFQDKTQMIEAILDRNYEIDKTWFSDLISKSREVVQDPLEQFLAFLELLAEEMSGITPIVRAACSKRRTSSNRGVIMRNGPFLSKVFNRLISSEDFPVPQGRSIRVIFGCI